MTWKREGNKVVEYDSQGKATGRTLDFKSSPDKNSLYYDSDGFTTEGRTVGLWGFGAGNEAKKYFGSNPGSKTDVEKAIDIYLNTGKKPSNTELGLSEKAYKNVMLDLEGFIKYNKIEDEDFSSNAKNPDIDTLNPYTAYLEQQRVRQEGAELGLLNAQTDANVQNAEITAQQNFMQQAQFKDQLVEQIKTDRLSKMRSGLTPMQIAQEDLQFMVGNMQMNNQQMQLVNQQRLMATQQKNMNPYQAFINSQAAVTGQQGYVNAASGFAATDAGDLNQQALRLRNNLNRGYFTRDDLKIAQDPNYKD